MIVGFFLANDFGDSRKAVEQNSEGAKEGTVESSEEHGQGEPQKEYRDDFCLEERHELYADEPVDGPWHGIGPIEKKDRQRDKNKQSNENSQESKHEVENRDTPIGEFYLIFPF